MSDEMVVGFAADLESLDSVPSGIAEVMNAAVSIVEDASATISEALTSSAQGFTALEDEAKTASESLSTALSSVNATKVVTEVDVAKAQLTLLEDKVKEARDKLQTLQNAADAGKSVTGLDVAQAQLTLLEAKAQNARESLQKLASGGQVASDEIATSSEKDASSVREIASAAQSASDSVLDSLGIMASGFSDLFNRIGLTIFSFQNMINMAQQVSSALLGPAISAETVSSALTTLLGSAKNAADMLAQLDAFASKTPFKTLDIDQAAETLLGFGINAQNVIPDIKAIGDALGSVGRDTPAELNSVVDIFGKIQTAGKLTTQDMMELGVHGINAWQALSDATGKPIPVLQRMVSAGLIPANDAIKDLTTGIEKNPLYTGGMDRASSTFAGLLSTLQSNWGQLMASFGSPIIKGLEGSLKHLGDLLATQGFKDFAGSVGSGIATVFGNIGSAVGRAWPFVQTFAGMLGSLGQMVGKDLAPAFDAFGKMLSPIGDLFSKSTGPASTFSGLLSNLKPLFDGIAGAAKTIGGDLAGLFEHVDLKPVLGMFKQVGDVVGGQFQQNFKFAGGIIQQLGQWFKSSMLPAIQQVLPGFEHLGGAILTTVVPAIAQLWAHGQQLARQVLPPLIQGFEAVAPVVVKVGGFLADKLGSAIQFLTPYVVQATEAVMDFGVGAIQRIEPLIQNLWTGINAGIQFILPIWNAAWPAMKEGLKVTWDVISGIVKTAWNLVSGIIDVGLDIFSGKWGKAWDDIKKMFGNIWKGIKETVINIWNDIKGTVAGGVNGVIDIINSMINGLDSIHVSLPGGNSIGFSIPDIPHVHFATGGYLQPGRFGVAGEEGPELIFGGSNGATIYNAAQTAALLGGGGSQPIHVHNHIYLNGREMTDFTGQQFINVIRSSGHPLGAAA